MEMPQTHDGNFGFEPAYMDFVTQRIYRSRFADGSPAPVHLLDGLPEEIVIDRLLSGRAVALKATVIAGFVRGGYFYTRSAAAQAAAEWPQGAPVSLQDITEQVS